MKPNNGNTAKENNSSKGAIAESSTPLAHPLIETD
jgi:hypothetical protein